MPNNSGAMINPLELPNKLTTLVPKDSKKKLCLGNNFIKSACMRRKICLLALIASLAMFWSCLDNEVRDVYCYEFNLVDENFWFPLKVGDSVTFADTLGATKTFVIADKRIVHLPTYRSDSGCNCIDVSGMLLVSELDSIWFTSQFSYVVGYVSSGYESVVFVLNGDKTAFFDSDRSLVVSYDIDTLNFENVKRFANFYADPPSVKSVHMARDLGIIRFELANGEVWTNTNLTEKSVQKVESFTFTEAVCE